MKLWPYTLSGPDFLSAYTVAIVLAVLAWLLIRARQRGVVRERIRDVPLDTYQLAYLRGGAVAAVESALMALLLAGKATRAGESFAAAFGATLDDRAHPLERAVLANLDHSGPKPRRRLIGHLERELQRLELQLVERGLIVPAGQRFGQSMLAKLALFGVGLAGVVRLFQGVEGGHPVGFLVVELLAVATLFAVLPRLPRRTGRGDAALTQQRAYHDATVCTATAAPEQLAPTEIALAYALAGPALGGVAAATLGTPRSQGLACGSSVATGCGCAAASTPWLTFGGSSGDSSSSGGDSGCGGSGGGCGGGGD